MAWFLLLVLASACSTTAIADPEPEVRITATHLGPFDLRADVYDLRALFPDSTQVLALGEPIAGESASDHVRITQHGALVARVFLDAHQRVEKLQLVVREPLARVVARHADFTCDQRRAGSVCTAPDLHRRFRATVDGTVDKLEWLAGDRVKRLTALPDWAPAATPTLRSRCTRLYVITAPCGLAYADGWTDAARLPPSERDAYRACAPREDALPIYNETFLATLEAAAARGCGALREHLHD